MDYIRPANRSQATLFPEVLDDYIDAEHTVRFIDAYIESLNLYELGFTHTQLASTGRPPYRAEDLLKLYVYGYLHGLRSSRVLEREIGATLNSCGYWVNCSQTLKPLLISAKTIRSHYRLYVWSLYSYVNAWAYLVDNLLPLMAVSLRP